MKKLIKILLLAIAIIVAGVLCFFVATEYRPKPVEHLPISLQMDTLSNDTLSILTWNIGYAGLNREMDFFFDGGKRVRCSEDTTLINLNAIKRFLQLFKGDFILIQEVDVDSKRTYGINEVDSLAKGLEQLHSFFCYNYKSQFVPVPLSDPYGRVMSGLMTLSEKNPYAAKRVSLGGQYGWPKRLFMPVRAILETRFRLPSGKSLVIFNTHCEAFDTGNIRKVEMDTIRALAKREYEQGNAVVIGGDWNQNPPTVTTPHTEYFNPIEIDKNHMPPGWSWVFVNKPTNRYNYEPYRPGKTLTTILDFFLVSPNVKSLAIDRIDLGFAHSDHNPVVMKFMLYNTPE
mgnify:CR=1 FL=1